MFVQDNATKANIAREDLLFEALRRNQIRFGILEKAYLLITQNYLYVKLLEIDIIL